MVGLQFVAEIVNFDALAWDLNELRRMKDNLFIGFFALLWWFLIVKAVLRLWDIVYGVLRAIGSGTPDRVNRRRPRHSRRTARPSQKDWNDDRIKKHLALLQTGAGKHAARRRQ